MKFPLARVATLFILGILCGEYVRAPLSWLFIAAFSLLLATIFISRVRSYGLCALVFVSGWTNYSIHTEILSANDLRLLVGERTMDVHLRGTISALDVRRYERDGKERWRTFAKLHVEAFRANDQSQPAEGLVLVSTSDSLAGQFHAGQQVEIGGVLHRPARPIAEGLFDYRAFLERQNIFYQMDTEPAEWTSLERSPSRPLSEMFLAWAKKTLFLGLNEEDQSLRLIWAMTLGWRSGMDHEVAEDFMRSGTMHIFAKIVHNSPQEHFGVGAWHFSFRIYYQHPHEQLVT